MNSGTINPILTNEVLAPTRIDYADLIKDIKPSMNVNIPLMQRTMEPTWTTERTTPLDINNVQEFSGGEASPPTSDHGQQYDANTEWLNKVIGYINPKKPIEPLSLGYIYARSSQPMKANGNAITSGISWGRDAQITSQMQGFQGSQNAADRALAQKMQSNTFQQQITMQQNSQNFQAGMQQRNFDFQHMMQGSQYQHENDMQERGIANQQYMQSSNQNFSSSMLDKTFGQNKALTGLQIAGTLANTALGGVVGVAGNIVSKGMDMYMQNTNFHNQQALSAQSFSQNKVLTGMNIVGDIANTVTGGLAGVATSLVTGGVDALLQNQSFHNQQNLMTQNYNQQIQASGSRAAALKLTTDS